MEEEWRTLLDLTQDMSVHVSKFPPFLKPINMGQKFHYFSTEAMAEIALLASIIPKLISLIENELNLHRNIRNELRTIRGELENMKAFLKVAENSTVEGNSLEEVWVKQVREVAFESEDIIDEFILHFEKSHRDESCTFLASMFSSCKNLASQHDFSLRMKDIISRFKEVCESNGRYRRVDPALNVISKRWHNPQVDALLKDDTLLGTDILKRSLINKLLGYSDTVEILKVLSVYGEGGLGKTSLVKKVYDDEEVRKNFNKQVWITVSRTFEPYRIFRDLIRQLHKEVTLKELDEFGHQMRGYGWKPENDIILQNMSSIELQQKAMEILRKSRYLVVLDDIWSSDAWNTLRYTFSASRGSRVLITTRNAEIALAASERERNCIFELTRLSDEHSLLLFCKRALGSYSCPAEYAEVTKSILKKCAGVPLAIEAIGAVIAMSGGSIRAWEDINANIRNELDNTRRVLSLSYTDLPYQIKPCYLYLSIFPEDYLIHKRRLTRLWIAEGFIPRMNNMTHEEVAEMYLKQLERRCLIQVVDTVNDGEAETYRIHDLLRDVIIEKAAEQCFAAIPDKDRDNKPWPVTVRRLSFHSNVSVEMQCKNLQRVRSIFIFDASVPSLFPNGFKFKLLTVLDMQGTVLKIFPESILMLTNLKYLNLSHTDLESVPSSVQRLWKLETLDLKYTRVTKLPIEILNLKRLRDLLAYQYKNDGYGHCGFKALKGLKSLTSLQSLLFVDAGGFPNLVKQIVKLSQLRRLGITNLCSKDVNDLSSLSKLQHLQVLSLSCSESEDNAIDLPSIVWPSKQPLETLYLTGKLESLPTWMPKLDSLVKLLLRSSNLENNSLELLGELPSLVHLQLVEACSYSLKVLHFKAGMFKKLKTLGLHELKYVVKVILENRTMPYLEWFRMVNCQDLLMVPEGIEYLSELSVLDFIDMPPAILTANVDMFEKMRSHIKEVNWIGKGQEDAWNPTRSRWNASRDIFSLANGCAQSISTGSIPSSLLSMDEDNVGLFVN